MDNNMIGYNQESINQLLDFINSSYEQLNWWLFSGFQNYVINQDIANGWMAPEAITSVQEISAKEKTICQDVYVKYENLYSAVIEAGKRWAVSVGADFIPSTGMSFNFPGIGDFDISSVKSNVNGFRGLDNTIVEHINSTLQCIVVHTNDVLNSTKSFVSTNTSFFGEDQARYLYQLVDSIRGKISECIKENVEIINRGIRETVEKYTQTAEANAQTFAAGN